MKGIWVLCGIVTLSACGGSPTAPQPVPSPPTQTIQPEPAPDPAPEAPAPIPPPSVPPEVPPMPEPPKPPKLDIYRGTVTWSQWTGSPAVPNQFNVEFLGDAVQFGPLKVPVALNAGDAVILRTPEVTISLRLVSPQTWQWTLNGLAGQAYGTLER